ncbi:MAG: DUF4960 domain-containing protein [Prevotella sp.]|nr:DUF4960 domain-containing protein [Prevotella sp.]MBR1556545.1 DUF4960 domain-containing protein [Prevotella sp.]MBR1901912.1 DUF4960 domain-containing protein [Bacteroidaceae bacterium]
MKKISFIIMAMFALILTACQDKDIDREAMKLSAPDVSQITGQLSGDDYILSWPAQNGQMMVTIYRNGTLSSSEVVSGNSFTHKNVPTNVPFEYVFKVTDGTNISTGVIKSYLREGATSISGVQMSQLDKTGGYDALVEWNKAADATSINFSATNGKRTINEKLSGSETKYVISDVETGDTWNVTLVAVNDKGTSLSTSSSLRIGKTAIGFLSVYATPEDLVENGDDDEASAWLWLHETYPTAQYLYFGDIKSADDIEPFRVLFWLRDLEGVGEGEVFAMPEVVEAATPVIREWYKQGGSLLLWSHATVYAGHLGRISLDEMKGNDRAIGTGAGGINNDVWKMAVELYPDHKFKKDHSTHPIYKGLEVETTADTKLIAFKGPGWTEDHNCLFFNLPSLWTGIGNTEEACYAQTTQTFGVYPLGTWDSQIWWVSQMNVWEAQQGNTDFQGTLLCIGNGGCEFSMKNADGTPDKSAHPKNNIYQDNVLTLAKNSLEYLKTR